MSPDIRITRGFPEEYRKAAVAIYDEAFERQLALAIPDIAKRREVLEAFMDPRYCYAAFDGPELVGVAGMHTPDGSLTGGTLSDRPAFRLLVEHLGLRRAMWAAVAFSMHTRTPVPGELLMDGIAVAAGQRGKGVGTKLLHAIAGHARDHGLTSVRLDVTDVNVGARALYEREGFQPVKTSRFRYMKPFLGFGGSTTMVLDVEP